jgi:hypothetical protein
VGGGGLWKEMTEKEQVVGVTAVQKPRAHLSLKHRMGEQVRELILGDLWSRTGKQGKHNTWLVHIILQSLHFIGITAPDQLLKLCVSAEDIMHAYYSHFPPGGESSRIMRHQQQLVSVASFIR